MPSRKDLLLQLVSDNKRACVDCGGAIADLLNSGMTHAEIHKRTKLSTSYISHFHTRFRNLGVQASRMCRDGEINRDTSYSLAEATGVDQESVLRRAKEICQTRDAQRRKGNGLQQERSPTRTSSRRSIKHARERGQSARATTHRAPRSGQFDGRPKPSPERRRPVAMTLLEPRELVERRMVQGGLCRSELRLASQRSTARGCLASFQTVPEFVASKSTVPQDFPQQARPKSLARVHWHNGASAIRVAKKAVATLASENREAQPAKCVNQLLTCEPGSPAHAATVTRWIPTNSNESSGPPPAARHTSIASRIR